MAEGPSPSIGRVVHFVLPLGANQGRARKADVVDVVNLEGNVCELIVSLATGDLPRSSDTDERASAVLRDSRGNALFARVLAAQGSAEQPGTWFWPPRV